jgi:transcriptional regulator with GAF, ATPase, and Fis domain
MRIDDLGKDIVDGEVIFREGDPGELKINSLVCVPLSSDAGRLGVLNLSTSTDKKFNMQDLNSVKLLATYSTMALRSAMQCGEMRKATEVLTNVLEELAE